jgi:SpoVK/Ycf46/Vps4 family AAA+-type ATPase
MLTSKLSAQNARSMREIVVEPLKRKQARRTENTLSIVPSGPGRFVQSIAPALRSTLQALMWSAQDFATMSPAFSPELSKHPEADLFHYLHAGAHFVFINGCQDDRASKVACTAVSTFKKDVPVRVLSWSSAQGWRELYPETGEPIARGDEGEVLAHDRAHNGKPLCFNDGDLLKELYEDPENADTLSPIETLDAISRFELKEVEEGKRGYALFVVNGMGPHFQDSLRGNGRLLQQLKDVRGELDSRSRRASPTINQIVFNDSAGLSPELVKELGISYEIPLPSREMLEQVAFKSITNNILDPEHECRPIDIKPAQVTAWKKELATEIPEAMIREAIADGVTLDAFRAFMPEGKSFGKLAEQLVGFTMPQAKNLMGEALSRAFQPDSGRLDFNFIAERRFKMLKEDFCLELVKPDAYRPKPVGLDAALEDLTEIKAVFERGQTQTPPQYPPKLILLTGVSGQGKSLYCKEAAELMNIPLYRLELGTLFSKWVGDSERNFARLFQVLEALSPCAIWIDEIEKALGGAREGSGQTHEVTNRVHGLFLTWLQEHSSRLLLMATCNEPQNLSSAVLNRADTKWFVGYTDPDNLPDLWKENLDALAKGHTLTRAQCAELAQLKPSITGREVSKRITKALRTALLKTPDGEQTKLTMEEVKKSLNNFRTDFEKDPERALMILSMSKGYEEASGRPIYQPRIDTNGESESTAGGSNSKKQRLTRDV